MEILSAQQIKEGDAYTIMHEPISSLHLMERAASRCAVAVTQQFVGFKSLIMLCGPGNNGGDGLVMACLLKPYFSQVHVFCFGNPEKRSFDFINNYNRLGELGIDAKYFSELDSLEDIFHLLAADDTLVGDALFGTGLSKPIKDSYISSLIHMVNTVSKHIFSVDIPSGMFADSNEHLIYDHPAVIRASKTFTFEQPKLSFMFAENADFVGEFQVIPIGVEKAFKRQQLVTEFFTTKDEIVLTYKPAKKFSHKGSFGHALLVGGSKGKAGAIALSAQAAISAGAGLATALVTEKVLSHVQSMVPEAMCVSSGENNYLAQIPALPKNITAIGIGPGMGMEKETVNVLKRLLAEINLPMVLDADALNILSNNKNWLSYLPEECILTPHPKEFDRLTKDHYSGYERWKTQVEFSKRYKVIVILKGAYTSITTPWEATIFNSTGNPGMATGGSGDVLTGILTALLAQKYSPVEACVLGTYIHGLAGDLAHAEKGREALLASDIIHKLGEAFKEISA